MLFLLVLRRRLAHLVALAGQPLPQRRPAQAAGIHPSRSDESGTPVSRVPALLHVAEERWAPVLMEMRYQRDDPLAVEFVFYGPAGALARWRFSRDLLLEGMGKIAGHGEVMIWPSGETSAGRILFLRLGLQDRQAVLAVRRSLVHHWLTRTLTTVPVGREMTEVDWDEEQRQLFRTV